MGIWQPKQVYNTSVNILKCAATFFFFSHLKGCYQFLIMELLGHGVWLFFIFPGCPPNKLYQCSFPPTLLWKGLLSTASQYWYHHTLDLCKSEIKIFHCFSFYFFSCLWGWTTFCVLFFFCHLAFLIYQLSIHILWPFFY